MLLFKYRGECVKYYPAFFAMKLFTKSDADVIIGNAQTAKGVLKRYLRLGCIVKIRQGFYCAVNPATGLPAADKFAIASHAAPGACISHRSALEYTGICPQSDSITFFSPIRLCDFEFGGIKYIPVTAPRGSAFVNSPASYASQGSRGKASGDAYALRRELSASPFLPNLPQGTPLVNCTSKEQAIIDCIKQPEYAAGVLELDRLLADAGKLNAALLISRLEAYANCFLYQKAGFFLSRHAGSTGLDAGFFALCRRGAGKSVRYMYPQLKNEPCVYVPQWSLYIPPQLTQQAYIRGTASDTGVSYLPCAAPGDMPLQTEAPAQKTRHIKSAEEKAPQTNTPEAASPQPESGTEKPAEVVWFFD